jgi:transcription factor C subunit 6
MLERFLPNETHERANASRPKTEPLAERTSSSTGAWSPEVSVHRVAWNDGGGLAGTPWLASATASGLCRVDWLEGRWMRGRIPYGGVTIIRKEVEGEIVEEDD